MQSSHPLPFVPPAAARRPRLSLRHAGGALLAGLLAGVVIAAVARWTHEEPPPTMVTDSELAMAYRFAESEATSETKGKRATIVGQVASIGRDERGLVYVALARGHVKAFVRADHRARADHLSEGMAVTTTCRVEGRVEGAVTVPSIVIARDCTIDEMSR